MASPFLNQINLMYAGSGSASEVLKTIREDITTFGKSLFKEFFGKLFDKNPDLKRVSWVAYSYYNDNDTSFTSFHEDFSINNKEPNGEEVYYESICDFLNQFDEEDMKMFFGEEVQVIVNRKGISIKEYSDCW